MIAPGDDVRIITTLIRRKPIPGNGRLKSSEKEGFGACSNEGECEAVCPKEISTLHIQILQRDYLRAVLRGD